MLGSVTSPRMIRADRVFRVQECYNLAVLKFSRPEARHGRILHGILQERP